MLVRPHLYKPMVPPDGKKTYMRTEDFKISARGWSAVAKTCP